MFENTLIYEEMYEKFLKNPSLVDSSWRDFFSNSMKASPSDRPKNRTELIRHFFHRHGYKWAAINSFFGVLKDRLPEYISQDPKSFFEQEWGALNQEELITFQQFQQLYSHQIGIEFNSDWHPEVASWLADQWEGSKVKSKFSQLEIWKYLCRAELLEQFLHVRFTGQKRFSLEGHEVLIPLLKAMIAHAAASGTQEVAIAMAHRGRMNVMANVLEKPYEKIFVEFDGLSVDTRAGDVKYHKGCQRLQPGLVTLTLLPNPSHLESVDAVLQGYARARTKSLSSEKSPYTVLSVQIHGDAAISGQGCVYESLQMTKLPGYQTGSGTIHLILNNQVGFTASPSETRSTAYCSDVAKAFDIPVFHVSAENPDSCLHAVALALELREKFGSDSFIEINGYRKYGHNESDEPFFTQPVEYRSIRQRPSIRMLYQEQLKQQGVLDEAQISACESEFSGILQTKLENSRKNKPSSPVYDAIEQKTVPNITQKQLEAFSNQFCEIPAAFKAHKKIQNQVAERQEMAEGKRPCDWAMAEQLAYAALLDEKFDVRLSGQDSCRGTFSQRHAVWYDQESGQAYCPLKGCEVCNSPLSEFGVMGFEYGYTIGHPRALVIWEAQYGDFCNGAQTIIDQYLSASAQKWGAQSRLVLFLPHGYEGQGPEHSSARVERFLALSAQGNWRVCNLTTPVQLFHLLRLHMYSAEAIPLILFTPKALLRHPECISPIADFTERGFKPVLVEPGERNVILCSGHVYYDLLAQRKENPQEALAAATLVRLEQLYPFPGEALLELFKTQKKVRYHWVQEEPQNMGPWDWVSQSFRELMPEEELRYHGRPRSASPATGCPLKHKDESAKIIQSIKEGCL